jgi:hypothetical protein
MCFLPQFIWRRKQIQFPKRRVSTPKNSNSVCRMQKVFTFIRPTTLGPFMRCHGDTLTCSVQSNAAQATQRWHLPVTERNFISFSGERRIRQRGLWKFLFRIQFVETILCSSCNIGGTWHATIANDSCHYPWACMETVSPVIASQWDLFLPGGK